MGKIDFEKEVMEKDALNRIMWDPKLNPDDFEICYADRPELKRINFSDIRVDGDFMVMEDKIIPVHRIRKIIHKGGVVWDKRRI